MRKVFLVALFFAGPAAAQAPTIRQHCIMLDGSIVPCLGMVATELPPTFSQPRSQMPVERKCWRVGDTTRCEYSR